MTQSLSPSQLKPGSAPAPADDQLEQQNKIRAMYSPDGSAYKGTWLAARKHGYGTKVESNGDVYQGEWRLNQAHGLGRFYARRAKLAQHTRKSIPERPQDDPQLVLVYEGGYEAGMR